MAGDDREHTEYTIPVRIPYYVVYESCPWLAPDYVPPRNERVKVKPLFKNWKRPGENFTSENR